MRFDNKNPKFLIDFVTMIFALIVIILTVVVILGGSKALLTFVFYSGAAMFSANIIRGVISHRYTTILLVLPAMACVAGGLALQGVIDFWIF